MDARHLYKLLESTVRLPTAPYHEGEVIAHAEAWAAQHGLFSRRDLFGNVVLRVGPEDGSPALAFAAHMDHPGFEIIDTSGSLVEARWMGGVQPEYFTGAKVRVFGEPGARGMCVRTELHEEGHRVDRMFLDLDGAASVGDMGSWDLVEFSQTGPMIHTRAADDLAGCAAVLGALATLAENQEGITAWGLLTRAEEVGFHGALGAIKKQSLPEGLPIIVLESSKILEGARQGAGPVIRVGDKKQVFDAGLCHFLRQVAESITRRHSDFSWQRALMDGGTCEATPYSYGGHRAAGIALPLGNYHNRTDDGTGHTLASENIHVGDFFGAVALMVEAARQYAQGAEKSQEALLAELMTNAESGLRRLGNDGLAGEA